MIKDFIAHVKENGNHIFEIKSRLQNEYKRNCPTRSGRK